MSQDYIQHVPLPELALWERLKQRRIPFSFDIEITARCNCNCRHCYINLPAGDAAARVQELSLVEIESITDQAVALGSFWCLVTGGEPLLRSDFKDIYLMLKKKGLLVSVFTNACLVSEEIVRLFQEFPPRDVEVTVYGATRETYEAVTRKPGFYALFRRGLQRLLDGGVKVRLKAMALRSNLHELPEITAFAEQHTADYFRYDPQLHLRYDGDSVRNAEIRQERLSPQEVAALEAADPKRLKQLRRMCDDAISMDEVPRQNASVFHCGAGMSSFSVRYDGMFRLCSNLNHPDFMVDLRQKPLSEAWQMVARRAHSTTSQSPEFQTHCQTCQLANLCLWCPANAHLETGRLDGWSADFCQIAHQRLAVARQSPDQACA